MTDLKFTKVVIPEETNPNRPKSSPMGDLVNLSMGLILGFILLLGTIHLSIDYLIPYIPPDAEKTIGEILTDKFIPETEARHRELQSALQDLLCRVALKTGLDPGAYRVHVTTSAESNAVSLPGGQIVFYSDLLEKASSENEVAMIIGHELGHYVRRDHLRGIGTAAVYLVLSVALFGRDGFATGLLTEYMTTVANGFSQIQEARADDFGLKALVAVYGHAAGATDFFSRMARMHEWESLAVFGTHPSFNSRVKALKAKISSRQYRVDEPTPWKFAGKDEISRDEASEITGNPPQY